MKIKKFEVEKSVASNFVIIWVFAIFSIYLITRGYIIGFSDHNEQIPLVCRFVDKNYLKNDWFVNQNDQLSPRFLFIWMVGSVSFFIGIETAYFLLYLILFLSICFILWQISALFIKIYPLGVSNSYSEEAFLCFSFVIISIFCLWASPDKSQILPSYLLPSIFAWCGILGAILLFLHGNIFAALFVAGCVGLFHVQLGPQTAFLFGYAFYMGQPQERGKMRKWIWLWITVITLPLIIGILISHDASLSLTESQRAARVFVFVRHPHLYLPWEFGINRWLTLIFYAAIVLLSRHRVGVLPVIDNFIIFIILWNVLGVVPLLIKPLIPLARLQPMRLMAFLPVAGGFYISRYFLWLVKQKDGLSVPFFVITLLSIIYSHKFFPSNDSGLIHVWPLPILVLLIFLEFARNTFTLSVKSQIFPLSILICGFLMLCMIIRLMWSRLPPFSILLLAFGLVLSCFLLAFHHPYKSTFLSVVVTLSGVWVLATTFFVSNSQDWIGRSWRFNSQFHYDSASLLTAPEAWARSHSPIGAVFLTSPNDQNFRLSAQRAIVVNFKTFPWADKPFLQWYTRLADVCGGTYLPEGVKGRQQILNQGYFHLSSQYLKHLARKYKADYIVVASGKKLNLPKVFSSKEGDIYRVITQSRDSFNNG